MTRFGGRRSACRYALYRARALVGGFNTYRRIDWSRVTRLVFVCAGNICRSPYAAERARCFGAAVGSCGTTAVDGASADPNASRIAQERGVSLQRHVSTSLKSAHFTQGDLVVALEPAHLAGLRPVIASSGAQATLMGLWCERRAPYIPDPFGKEDRCFRFVFDLVDEALASVLPRVRR